MVGLVFVYTCIPVSLHTQLMVYYTNDSITRTLEKVLHELQVARASIFDGYKAQEHVGGEMFCHAGDGARTGGGLPRLNITPSFA